MKKLTLENKKKAVEIAMAGGNPNEYLKTCGVANPSASWNYIRKSLMEKDPEKYEQLMKAVKTEEDPSPSSRFAQEDRPAQAEVQTVDRVPEVTIDGAIRMKTTDGSTVDLVRDESVANEYRKEKRSYPVTGIRTDYGEFYYDHKFNSIDWRTEGGDEIGMGPIAWKNFAEELQDILRTLGVDVHE